MPPSTEPRARREGGQMYARQSRAPPHVLSGMDDRHALHWSDQPKECEPAEVVARIYLREIGVIEVRAGEGTWYLTAGNLWGSQTLRCRDATVAWRVLDQLYNQPKKRRPILPLEGAELVEEPEKTSA